MKSAIEQSSTRAVAKATAGTELDILGEPITADDRVSAARAAMEKFRAEMLAHLDGVLEAVQAAAEGKHDAQGVYDVTCDLCNESSVWAEDLHHAIGMIFMPRAFADSFEVFERLREEIGLPLYWRRFWAA